jgi:hypothetical protein
MIFTRAAWPPFPRPHWPQCPCSEQAQSNGERRLTCRACGALADRPLPAKLKVGEEACKAIEKAERLIAQLAKLEFQPGLTREGKLVFYDLTGATRDLSKFCPPAHAFAVIMAALEVDESFIGPPPDVAIEQEDVTQRLARWKQKLMPAEQARLKHLARVAEIEALPDDGLTMIERIVGRRVLEPPPDLAHWTTKHGGYAQITAEGWAEYRDAKAQWRERPGT